ncbi:MAG: hypothetical protein ACP5T3_01315 [Candidatus Micrarchaeia archaeon]
MAARKGNGKDKECDELRRYNNLYLIILMRYKDYIESEESLSVAELPKLVTPEDPAIAAYADDLKSHFQQYDFESNFEEAASLAHEFVTREITTAVLPLQFWLKPSETMAAKAGDALDKATLLCSTLIALGNITAKIVIVTKGGERKTGVYCEYKGNVIYYNIEGGTLRANSKEELMNRLGVKSGEDVTAYEFNDKMYNDLA